MLYRLTACVYHMPIVWHLHIIQGQLAGINHSLLSTTGVTKAHAVVTFEFEYERQTATRTPTA
jgi:hypothetical protein